LVFVVCTALVVTAASRTLADEVIGAKRSKVYHTHPSECGAARNINPENRIKFASIEEAEKAGRRLCKRCVSLDLRGAGEEAESQPAAELENRRKEKPPEGHERSVQRLTGEVVAALPEIARISRVHLGGTIELDTGEKVRLLGVVWPVRGQPLAEEAAAFVKEQTDKHRVRMTHDAADEPAGRRDALGRLLVYMTPQPDGRDLGGELLFRGYVWLDRESLGGRHPEYARRLEEAWRAGRGVWRQLDGAAGESKVVTGRHAHHYHDLNCPHVQHLTGELIITLNEAKSRRLPPCPRYHATDKNQGRSGKKPKDVAGRKAGKAKQVD
jgi:endonuclease YncB( thermonuclease family)